MGVRNIRNFWVEAEIDGRETTLAGGPRDMDGGMEVVIKMRHENKVVEVMKIKGYVDSDGQLVLTVRDREFIRWER